MSSAAAERFRTLVVGVGGQGVLTAARILGEAALLAGREVVVGQLHGMSQRGGSVSSSVLVGPGLGSFVVSGGADLLLGFEPLEVLRARPAMDPATRVVLCRNRIEAHTLTQAGCAYPDVDQIIAQVREVTREVVEVDGAALLRAAGAPGSLNIAMLGVLAGLEILPFDPAMLWRAIESRLPARTIEPNRRAFDLGRGEVRPWTSH